jgi:SNF family Na+-dependent transporter
LVVACTDAQAMTAFLKGYQGVAVNEYFAGSGPAYLFFIITCLVNVVIIGFGISRGIERFCTWALPLLLVIACILVVRVLTLGTPDSSLPQNSVVNGLGFLWNPDWSRLKDAKVWLSAAGQIFFSLSAGFGVILTYASYLRKQDDVALSGLTAATTNEFAEVVLGGSIVIPAAFAFIGPAGMQAIAGQGVFDLGFVTMPLIFQKMAYGQMFGFLWFFLLFIAGVTSTISLAMPAIAFLEDEFNLTRREATMIFGVVTFILTQPVIFFLGNGVLDEMDFWGTSVCLVVFATVEAILFAWVFGMDRAWTEMHKGSDIRIPGVYRWIIKYVTPLMLITILAMWAWQEWKNKMMMTDVSEADKPFLLLTRIGLGGLFLFLLLMVWIVWKRRPQTKEEVQ